MLLKENYEKYYEKHCFPGKVVEISWKQPIHFCMLSISSGKPFRGFLTEIHM